MKYKGFTYTPTPKTAWDNLSMQEKSEMMKVAVKNGITDLNTIKEQYNEFAEGGYLDWKEKASKYKHLDIDNDRTYDYEGWYNENPQRAWNFLNDSPDAHFDDKYKTGYHPTFSTQSKYSGKKDATYNPLGLVGGTWNKQGTVFTMSPDGYRGPVRMDDRKWYLENAEDNGVQLREADGSLPVFDGIPWGGVLPNVTITGNRFANGGGIHIKDSKKGTFTAAAKKHGKSVQAFASQVLAHPENYSPAMRKKANFARNASHWKHGLGGSLFYPSNKNFYGFGDWLKKGWDWLKNSAQVAAIAENPAVMMAAGQRVNKQGKVEYNHAQDKDVRQLRSNVFTIGETGLAAPTLVGDIEAVYQAAKHPIQTARAIKKVAQEGVRAVRNHVNHSSRMPIATKSVEEESFIPDFFLKDTKPVTRESVLQDLEKAKAYKESEGYRSLVEDFLKETGEPDIPADVFYSSRHTNVPNIVLEKRPSGHFGGYNYSENRISIDPGQAADDVPFHEGLHWQRVGKPEVEKGPDYVAWGKSFDENAPKDVQDALFSRYYNSEIGKRAIRQEDAIKALYEKKINNVVYPDVPRTSEMRKPEELIAHTFGVGKSLGLQPFQEYPGFSRALNIIEKARKKDSWLWDIKAGGEEQIKDFWKLLTGNYMPATVGGATITGLTVPKR